MQAHQFLAKSYSEMVEMLSQLASDPSSESTLVLQELLRVRDAHTYDKHDIPRLVCRALLEKGAVGVQALVDTLPDAPGSIYPSAIVRSLWKASLGKTDLELLNPRLEPKPPLDGPLDPAIAIAAFQALKGLVAEGSDDFRRIPGPLEIAMSNREPSDPSGMFDELWDIFLGGQLRINSRIIDLYEALVGGKNREETYQKFLRDHPVLLDPLAAHVIPKQRLGIDHVTDFVVKRFDGAYIVVEIEKPQDRLFVRSGDFSSAFTHAYGQIVDFLAWINDHGEYARTLMPGITAPTGLLVMGTSAELTAKEKTKLSWLNQDSRSVSVVTFDQLAEKARQLYANIVVERKSSKG